MIHTCYAFGLSALETFVVCWASPRRKGGWNSEISFVVCWASPCSKGGWISKISFVVCWASPRRKGGWDSEITFAMEWTSLLSVQKEKRCRHLSLHADFQMQKERGAVRRKVLPLELKTGKASYSVEHKGQVGHRRKQRSWSWLCICTEGHTRR